MGIMIDVFKNVKKKYFKEADRDYIDEVRYYEKKLILVIKKMQTYKELEDDYCKVLDKIAAHIQDKIEDELDNLRWNIYLVFIVDEKIEKEKHKKIIAEVENDTYCCKKYVLSNINSSKINKVIEENIPIFINLENIKSKKEDELKGNKSKIEIKMPHFIENYLKNENKKLDDFLSLTFDDSMIDSIYGGEKNENKKDRNR